MPDSLRRAERGVEDFLRQRPKSGIGGALLVVLLVAIGVWVWPELKRTIHIHRM
jgi:hypothetical protein